MVRALPKIDMPIFDDELPSGKRVKYRPFTGKEEKILLMGQESKNFNDSLVSIMQVVNNCLVDESIENITSLDFEYLVLKIRSKSVSNVMEFVLTEGEKKHQIAVNIDEIQIKTDPKHEGNIVLNDRYTLQLIQPNIFLTQEYLRQKEEGAEYADYNFMLKSFAYLSDAEEGSVFDFKEYSADDIVEFADGLSKENIEKVKLFFETLPVIRHEVKYMTDDGEIKTLVIEGMEFFFG